METLRHQCSDVATRDGTAKHVLLSITPGTTVDVRPDCIDAALNSESNDCRIPIGNANPRSTRWIVKPMSDSELTDSPAECESSTNGAY